MARAKFMGADRSMLNTMGAARTARMYADEGPHFGLQRLGRSARREPRLRPFSNIGPVVFVRLQIRHRVVSPAVAIGYGKLRHQFGMCTIAWLERQGSSAHRCEVVSVISPS
jgi:hypothetical protein